MKKLLFLMLLPMVVGLVACDYHDRVIGVGDLPTKTTLFISDVFPGCEVVAIDKDRDSEGVTYDVVLDCGVKLEFNKDGEWREVDCEPNRVPDVVVLTPILNYVKQNYANYFIVKIEHKWGRYNVELNVDIELVFDKDGGFIRMDD